MAGARDFLRNKRIVLGTAGDLVRPVCNGAIEVIVADPKSVSPLISLLSVVL